MVTGYLPTVFEVSQQGGQTEVNIDPNTNLTTYKDFMKEVLPKLRAANPKAPVAKLIKLGAFMWRQYDSIDELLDSSVEEISTTFN